jgi:hypothetical protein
MHSAGRVEHVTAGGEHLRLVGHEVRPGAGIPAALQHGHMPIAAVVVRPVHHVWRKFHPDHIGAGL